MMDLPSAPSSASLIGPGRGLTATPRAHSGTSLYREPFRSQGAARTAVHYASALFFADTVRGAIGDRRWAWPRPWLYPTRRRVRRLGVVHHHSVTSTARPPRRLRVTGRDSRRWRRVDATSSRRRPRGLLPDGRPETLEIHILKCLDDTGIAPVRVPLEHGENPFARKAGGSIRSTAADEATSNKQPGSIPAE